MDGQRRLPETNSGALHVRSCDGVYVWLLELLLQGQSHDRPGDFRNYLLCGESSGPGTPFRCCVDHFPGVSDADIAAPPNASEWDHTVRQEHFIPQACGLLDRFLYLGPHNCPLEQLCPARRQGQPWVQGLCFTQLHDRSWLVRLHHARSTDGHGRHIYEQIQACQL